MSREDVYALPSIRVVIPAGGIAQIGPIPGQIATSIKLAVGGTLEIGGYSMTIGTPGLTMLAGAGIFQTGQTFGQMYAISANEVFSCNASGAVYLYASGATCVAMVGLGRSQGFDTI